MNIHEYQAKALLKTYGVSVPHGLLLQNIAELSKLLAQVQAEIRSSKIVVKAQVLAGGRGKAGGIKVVDNNASAITDAVQALLGKTLVTQQSGAQGVRINKVYLEEGVNIAQELYLSMIFDRKHSNILLIASQEGGTEIEELAHNQPDKVLKIPVDMGFGLCEFHLRKLAYGLGIKEPHLYKELARIVYGIYELFMVKDAQQVEINPLIITKSGEILALDAKIGFDENALYRHPEIEVLREQDAVPELERQAKQHDLSYIMMEGNIGCMVNGAGLAMATMDTINLYGGRPANFLDVGGSASADKVSKAFQIICQDSNVRAILVNIFGGIMRCDTIAEGIIQAMRQQSIAIPVVVRLEGTRSDVGRALIAESGLSLYSVDGSIDDAAEQAVRLVKGAAG